MFEEYDIISRGMEEDAGSSGESTQDESGSTTGNEDPTLEGYEKVFDIKVGLRPVTLVPVTY